MSLDVPGNLLERAHNGEPIPNEEFVRVVKESLPYAWRVVSGVAARLDAEGVEFTDDATPPIEEERGQLLRAFASDAIRASLEDHFGVRLGFQNCHRVAAFRRSPAGEAAHATFTSLHSQLLNQSPELRDC